MDTAKEHWKTIVILVAIVCVVGFFTYARFSPSGMFSDLQNDLKAIESNETAPYTDLDGNPIDLKSYKGKPLIVNAWATWIPFSKDELKLLSEIQNTYGDKISVLAINRMEVGAVIRSYLSIYEISTDALRIVIDPTDNFYTAIGGFGMPETIVYRRDGTIALHKRGVLTKEELVTVIDGTLTE